MKQTHKGTLIAVVAIAMLTAACAKKKVAAVPPTPPTPTANAAPVRSTPAPARSAVARPPASASTPAPHYPPPATRARIDQLLARIEDAYFDYDKAALRPDALKALEADSTELRDILKDYPDYKLTVEGHCDERGSAEYNIALGEKRAEAAKSYLVGVGIPSAQLNVVSYGKEHPICDEHDETCWQRNRRIHIVAAAQSH
ncbi:MAG TPA: OmpA family protein [Bryobacteraceae bacterium]|nr:OmpA family protein [Bryobacteraceae bacterium]